MIDPIDNALRQLRESAAEERASDALENKLLIAFRAKHNRPVSSTRSWAWISAAAVMASVLLAVAWHAKRPAAIQMPAPLVVKQPPIEQNVRNQPPSSDRIDEKHTAEPRILARHKNRNKPRVDSQVAEPPRRQEQEFIEIPYAPALEAFDGGQVVRVNMRGASMRRLGLPVMTDRVQADLLLGEDGVARAVRLVSNSGLNSTR